MCKLVPALLIAILLGACAPTRPAAVPEPALYPTAEFTPVPAERVAVWAFTSDAADGRAVRVASQRLPAAYKRSRSQYLATFRSESGARGANVIVVERMADGSEEWVAYYFAAEAARVRAAGGTTAGSSAQGCTGSCDVQVKGYRRKDGTYVKPHTRSRPGTKKGRKG